MKRKEKRIQKKVGARTHPTLLLREGSIKVDSCLHVIVERLDNVGKKGKAYKSKVRPMKAK